MFISKNWSGRLGKVGPGSAGLSQGSPPQIDVATTDRMLMSPPNSDAEILIPKVTVWGGRTFRRGLCHECEDLTIGVSALKRETTRHTWAPPPREDTARRWSSAHPAASSHQTSAPAPCSWPSWPLEL